jgi:hypothetical protein
MCKCIFGVKIKARRFNFKRNLFSEQFFSLSPTIISLLIFLFGETRAYSVAIQQPDYVSSMLKQVIISCNGQRMRSNKTKERNFLANNYLLSEHFFTAPSPFPGPACWSFCAVRHMLAQWHHNKLRTFRGNNI